MRPMPDWLVPMAATLTMIHVDQLAENTKPSDTKCWRQRAQQCWLCAMVCEAW